ncbi:uncharacterized protein ACRADG_011149 [Cochliomyia hominivorax]
MFNKKSLDLKKDEKKPKEKLYQPKKCCWCKFIVLPLLIGFILLLILSNVDFTGESHNQTSLQTNASISKSDNTPVGSLSPDKSSRSLLSRGLNCKQSVDTCSLTCIGGNINNIYKLLEPLYKSCNKDLDLILIDCSLPSSRLKSNFFMGNYRLKSVNIKNCNLAAIDNKVFVQNSVKNLKNLILINTVFTSLDMSDFEGLQQLDNFFLINKITSCCTFWGNGFLQHFSETLTNLVIQLDTSSVNIYDPLPWFQGKDMKRLTNVTLANNNFRYILDQKTFSTLISVEYLNLSNCTLTFLEANVFDNILKTLRHLDLSYNYLTTLPGEMLWQMSSLELNLTFNYWECTCDNREMLQFIKWNTQDITFLNKTNVRCYTPEEWKNVPIDDLILKCLLSTTTLNVIETTKEETDEPQVTTKLTPLTTVTPTNTTTESSVELSTVNLSSSSDSSSSSDCSSNQSSEETNETSEENNKSTTAMVTTTIIQDTTISATKNTTTSTTLKPAKPTITHKTTTPTSPPFISKIRIYCNNTNNEIYFHDVLKEKTLFTIKPHSETSVKLVTNNLLSNTAVVYFHNFANYAIISNIQQLKSDYFTIIKNLNSSTNYIFCLIQQLQDENDNSALESYNWNVSPFDCRSYSWPVWFWEHV